MGRDDDPPLPPRRLRSRLRTGRNLPLLLLLPTPRSRFPVRDVRLRRPPRVLLRRRARIRDYERALQARQLATSLPGRGGPYDPDGAGRLLLRA